jgi:hypothetical protein
MIPPLAVLFAWPVISGIIFSRLHLPLAVIASLLAAFLFLPEIVNIDLPLLPAIDKYTIASFSALAFALAFAKNAPEQHVMPGIWTRNWLAFVLLIGAILSAFLTILANGDPIDIGPRILPALRPYDAFSAVLLLMTTVVPMVLARKFLARPEHHVMILAGLVFAASFYAFLALYEVRMSPRINSMTYGFFPHEWRQHMRGGGFRPLVFLKHGLVLAMFLCLATLAAFGLSRIDKARQGLYLFAGFWLLGTLVLAKSLGALMITLILIPVVWFFSPRMQVIVAASIAFLFLLYPVVRSANLVPVASIESFVANISQERAESLRVRLDNEDAMLARGAQRPVFGWGGWGRDRVRDAQGRDQTIADGTWIIVLNQGGWLRYITELGLVTAPLLLLLIRFRQTKAGLETGLIAVLLAGNLVDLIPNSSITPITWMLAGALWGRLELGAQAVDDAIPQQGGVQRLVPTRSRREAQIPAVASEPSSEQSRQSPYTRQTERVYRSQNEPS